MPELFRLGLTRRGCWRMPGQGRPSQWYRRSSLLRAMMVWKPFVAFSYGMGRVVVAHDCLVPAFSTHDIQCQWCLTKVDLPKEQELLLHVTLRRCGGALPRGDQPRSCLQDSARHQSTVSCSSLQVFLSPASVLHQVVISSFLIFFNMTPWPI